MADFEIIVGSVLGASEYVADALQEKLSEYQLTSNIWLTPDLADLDKQSIWLVCTSTHGAGDLPDNIQPWVNQLKKIALDKVLFLVIGLGDSSYDTFCNGARQIEETLTTQGATLLTPALHIDVLHHPIPEVPAASWLDNWLQSRG
jgi:MioC protein